VSAGPAAGIVPAAGFGAALSGRRVLNGALVAAAGIGSVFYPPALALILAGIATFGIIELRNLARRAGGDFSLPVSLCGSLAYVILPLLGQLQRFESALVGFIVLGSMLSAFRHGTATFFERSSRTAFAALYLGKPLSYFLLLDKSGSVAHGIAITIWTIVVVALTDIVGMVVGLRIGRTPLAPHLSPRKTWEGAIAACIVATGAATLLSFAPQIAAPWWLGLMFGFAVSCAAVVGDLVESALKRNAHVKDSGEIMPGHGGVLDRFDSYLVAGFIAYTVLGAAGRL
jgi:phosphatidate cytidylyltransferase